MTIKVTLFDDAGDERDVLFPAHWEICPQCEGGATDRGAGVECDGGGFTASEWAEQDDDFKQDYLAGRYDRPCAPCAGLGRIQVIDRAQCAKADLKLFDRQQRELRDMRREERMERMSGA